MRKLNIVLTFIALVFVLACGGGGGGSSTPTPINLFGRVINVSNGNGLKGATLQVGSVTTTITSTDGSFSMQVPSTGGTLVVNSGTSTITGWSFTVPVSTVDTDLGDLYVGPSQVSVAGRLVDSTNANPISGGTIKFAGRSTTTAADGTFTITQVAFDASNTATFGAIVGTANATGYFQATFTNSGATVANSVVQLPDVSIIPQGTSGPPSTPYTLFGKVSPLASAPGTTVRLFQGATPIRTYTVGTDGMFYLWVPAGSYRLTFQNGTLSAPDASVTVPTDTVVRQDATLQ